MCILVVYSQCWALMLDSAPDLMGLLKHVLLGPPYHGMAKDPCCHISSYAIR